VDAAPDAPAPAIRTDDLDVDIVPAGRGFTIRWTAVVLPDAGVDGVVRRPVEVTFEPAGRPGLFHAVPQTDPMAGGVVGWARLAGDVLSVHQFPLRGRDGFLLVDYERRIGGDGMEVVIRWLRDGQDVVSLRGSLGREGGAR